MKFNNRNVYISSKAVIGKNVKIGDDTIMGNFISCHAENHNYADAAVLIRQQGVTRNGIVIGKNCWIGSKVTILDGAQIGDGCIIAAGAVVPAGVYRSNAIYGGVPAKFIKESCITC